MKNIRRRVKYKMKLSKISKKELFKNFMWELILVAVITIYFYLQYEKVLILDSLLLSGILFFSVGLFRVTMHLGLFNLVIFGFKKSGSIFYPEKKRKEISSIQYHDFLAAYQYNKSPWTLILPGAAAMLLPFAALIF